MPNIEESIRFFTKMAIKYRDCPNVIFEIYNEPRSDSWSKIKDYSVKVIGAIRNTGSDHLIIAGTPSWSQNVDEAANDPITGFDNIAYALHFYAGTHHDDLRTRARNAIQRELPLFISECGGVNADGNGNFNHAEWGQWLQLIKENDLSAVFWHMGNTDKFETSSAIKQHSPAEGPWQTHDFTESGQAFLRFIKSKPTPSLGARF